jgi:hypothetical protein
VDICILYQKKELVLVLIVFLSEGSFYGQKKWNLLLFGNKIPQKIDRNLPKKKGDCWALPLVLTSENLSIKGTSAQSGNMNMNENSS